MMSDVETCKNCKYVDHEIKYSWCHRYPPIVTSEGDVMFPSVNDVNWCGEFKKRETLLPITDQSVKLPPIRGETISAINPPRKSEMQLLKDRLLELEKELDRRKAS